jgi:hypothetical protein
VNQTVQESPGRDDDGVSAKAASVFQDDPGQSSVIQNEIDDFALPQMEIRSRFERAPHLRAITHAVRLRAWRLNRRPARAVEQTKLDTGSIDDATHNAAERVDLADEMSFRNAANGRIAGHLTDEVKVQSNQAGLRAESRRGRRCLAASMAGANHDYIKCLVKRHDYFPIQNVANISDSISSVVVAPGTFLTGLIHTGRRTYSGGRAG